MLPQQYCLRWKHHHSNVQSMFAQLLEKERFCDVTLYCSPNFVQQVPNKDTVDPQNIRGVSLKAHRVVLAACSELLGSLLGAHEAQGEPVLVIDGAEPQHLKALLDYMYTGEMNVHHSQLASLLKTAEELRIKGLTDIRWNNKDEPPDCTTGAVTTVPKLDNQKQDKKAPTKQHGKQSPLLGKQIQKPTSPLKQLTADLQISEPRSLLKRELDDGENKVSVNGGPPPLIKISKDKILKRENSDSEHSPSPKRTRLPSGTEHTDDEIVKMERDIDWQHGNLDITAERVCNWGGADSQSQSREASDDEWADAPTDIGSFLHTNLRVDGDNTNDEESLDSNSGNMSGIPVSIPIVPAEPLKQELHVSVNVKQTTGPKSGPTDHRFTDVVKLSDYLQHGRRPQFWEEHYVKRVMEAVRLKELEMKQAAEILGVSYGTLYGRYRDVYGCINRPYRAVRDFWQVKGPSEVLERLQRGEISLDAAASALGVSVANLAAHVADFGPATTGDFDPIPIEVDPSLRNRSYSTGSAGKPAVTPRKPAPQDNKPAKKVIVGSSNDDECIPVCIISTTQESTHTATSDARSTRSSGKWPSIRVANIDSLRSTEASASPSQLMRTRPDLTIVAAKKPETEDDNIILS